MSTPAGFANVRTKMVKEEKNMRSGISRRLSDTAGPVAKGFARYEHVT
jgi:hypothetical protein